MTNFFYFQIHGGASGGGFIVIVAEFLEFIESLFGKTPPEAFSTLLPGIASMDNIHPLLVHFPIAFLVGFFLLDFAGSLIKKSHWRYAASCLLYLGTISAGFTVMAGLVAAESVVHDGNVHDIMERHEHIGISVLALAIFLSVWRSQSWGGRSIIANRFFLGISAFLCLLLSFGADLGGLMVYGHGVGVASTNIQISESAGNSNGNKAIKSSHGEHSHGGHSHNDHNNDGHNHGDHDHSHED